LPPEKIIAQKAAHGLGRIEAMFGEESSLIPIATAVRKSHTRKSSPGWRSKSRATDRNRSVPFSVAATRPTEGSDSPSGIPSRSSAL
jgi:hypothetical protein